MLKQIVKEPRVRTNLSPRDYFAGQFFRSISSIKAGTLYSWAGGKALETLVEMGVASGVVSRLPSLGFATVMVEQSRYRYVPAGHGRDREVSQGWPSRARQMFPAK